MQAKIQIYLKYDWRSPLVGTQEVGDMFSMNGHPPGNI